MKKSAWIPAFIFALAPFAFADSWTGRLVDAMCKASSEGLDSFTASCPATESTHLFAIELADLKVLSLDAVGNEKASDAIRNIHKNDVRVTITGSLDGKTVRVQKLELRTAEN